MQEKLPRTLTGNHLVAIVAIIAFTVCVPGTLWAVAQFTNVAIMDPNSGRKVFVDENRALQVVGNVYANPAPLLNAFRKYTSVLGSCIPIATAASGKALLIKTINVDGVDFTPTAPHYIAFGIGPDCASSTTVEFVDFAETGNENLAFDPGIVVPSGQGLFATSSQMRADIAVTGYQMRSDQLPASGSVTPLAAAGATASFKR